LKGDVAELVDIEGSAVGEENFHPTAICAEPVAWHEHHARVSRVRIAFALEQRVAIDDTNVRRRGLFRKSLS